MSFNFSPNVPPPVVFGSAAKRTPFGSMAAPAASSAPSMFGGSGFGTTTTKPTTGFSSFGNTTATSIGGTGSLPFGGGASTFASTAPTFGSTGPTFGSTAPTFGSTAPTFGSTAPAFGSTAPTFGTGAPTFGSAAPTFGTNTLTTNTFGGGGALSTGSTFGSTFGQKPATSGFGGFGTGLNTTFGQQNQLPQQQQGPGSAHEALVAAVFNCSVFGDERDQVLAKWNLLQAQWGTGQAYYSRNAPPLELNEQNPLCRFKAVGYSRLGSHDDKDGHVVMMFNKSAQEINTNKQVLQTSLSNLFGNKPNLVVNIDSVKAVTETKSQVLIYVVDKNANNAHISATELAAFMNAGAARTALNGAGCGAVTAVTRPTPQALAQYLQTPPPGMDMRLWKQAQADNPDPDNYIPVPIIGFSEIKSRAHSQREEASLQAEWLKRAADTLGELRTRRAAAAARLAQLAGKLHALRHTLLQAIGRKEVMGRVGAALSPEEEEARMRLHDLACTLSTPPLYNANVRKEVMGRVGAALSPEEEEVRTRLHDLACTLSTPPLYNANVRKEVMGRVGAALSPEEEEVRTRLHDLACTLSTPPLYNANVRKEVMGRVGAALSPEEEEVRTQLHDLACTLSTPPLYNANIREEVMGRVGAALSPEEEEVRTRLHDLACTLSTPPLYNANVRKEVMGRVGAALSPEEEEVRTQLHDLACTLSTPPLYNANIRKEVMGRVGAALSPEEEEVRTRLHDLAYTPPLYNGRLNELLSAVRLQRSAVGSGPSEQYQLDPGAQEDLKQFLTLQQRGMAHLLDTARKDLDALNTIAEGMSRLVRA